jgi:hypothetical protein
MRVRPCGSIDWLASKIDLNNCSVILGSSSEARWSGLLEWLTSEQVDRNTTTIFKIENPPSDRWNHAKKLRDHGLTNTLNSSGKDVLKILDCDLMGSPMQYRDEILSTSSNSETVILDISVLPKRFFAFIIKLLLPTTKNLVITYCSPASYPETQLCFGARPPEALPGFSQASTTNGSNRKVVVSLGFVPLSVDEIVGSGIGTNLEIIFPFPTSPAGYRRNWRLLGSLFTLEDLRDAKLRRIHSLDAFEVCDLITELANLVPITAIPLGPKAHTLGMVLAALKPRDPTRTNSIQLIYPQPKEYLPNYSEGIKLTKNEKPSIFAYCLKNNGQFVY